MPDLQIIIAAGDGVALSLGDFLRSLHQRQQLRKLALEALAEQLVLHAAAQASHSVSDADLQQAADRFRQRHGITTAEQTHAWLLREGLSIDDFEAALERDLLLTRFRHHLTQPRLADHFAAHRDRHARARLRQVVVASEGEARELLSQLADEGADFGDLARQHSLDGPSRQTGGAVGVVPRRTLPADVAEAMFAAVPGRVVGPFATRQGFYLYLVEELLPAELDAATADAVRQELFDAWLRERLRDVRIDLSWLGAS